MFWPPPPKILTTGPPEMGASGQNPCQIASEHPEMCKIFACGRLIREELIALVILGCKERIQIDFLYLVKFFSSLCLSNGLYNR